jgi:type III restriction enzyme
MELKNYQRRVLRDLDAYLACLNEPHATLAEAFRKFWLEQGVAVGMGAVAPYKNVVPGTPHVCFKVPTGGGKTFIACCAVLPIVKAIFQNRPQVVVWLVPSNAILEQTVQTLQDKDHPYRHRLDVDFQGRVEVCTKDELLNGQNFNPTSVREQLTLCVLSYDSLRSAKKDGRLVYRENSALADFATLYPSAHTVEGADDTALIQALNGLNPIVIVDESHNAESYLSVEMLNNLDPSFVLDLTATPKANSNIISFVDARALKEENMVKLPVIVYNRNDQADVLMDALTLRSKLEEAAQAEMAASGRYIRPIILFQAQPKGRDQARTFTRIKEDLLAVGIPENEIAIKTADINELRGVELKSPDCKIRFIITINALKEGWDCPFAYILATLANKTSSVDVEQILGRVLRLPDAQRNTAKMLNMAYVLTCSNDFRDTLEQIVKGLNRAGFTRKDCLVQDAPPVQPIPQPSPQQTAIEDDHQDAEDYTGVDVEAVRQELERRAAIDSDPSTTDAFREMEAFAQQQGDAYEAGLQNLTDLPLAEEVIEKMPHYAIQPQFRESIQTLILPQFYRHTEESLLLAGKDIKLSKEALTKGFTLAEQDARVDFTATGAKVAEVDIQANGEAVPKHRYLSARDSKAFRDAIETAPSEKKTGHCIFQICALLDKDDTLVAGDLRKYVERVVQTMQRDDLEALEHSVPAFAYKIKEKIESLQAVYRQKRFDEMLETGNIICTAGLGYTFPEIITPVKATENLVKTLYEAEADDMNGFEFEAIQQIASLDNVMWWHRVMERRGFSLNGAITHYPDFVVCTASGTILLVETKGDHLINDETKQKLHLGRAWQHQLGQKYKYLMVFRSAELHLEGAVTLDKALQLIGQL